MEAQLRWAGVIYSNSSWWWLGRRQGAGVSHHQCFSISLRAVFGPLMHKPPVLPVNIMRSFSLPDTTSNLLSLRRVLFPYAFPLPSGDICAGKPLLCPMG